MLLTLSVNHSRLCALCDIRQTSPKYPADDDPGSGVHFIVNRCHPVSLPPYQIGFSVVATIRRTDLNSTAALEDFRSDMLSFMQSKGLDLLIGIAKANTEAILTNK